MKLNDKFILHISGDETILVATGDSDFSGIVKGNKTLGKILELLKDETSEEKIVSYLKDIYEGDTDVIANDVKNALAKLREIGALDE